MEYNKYTIHSVFIALLFGFVASIFGSDSVTVLASESNGNMLALVRQSVNSQLNLGSNTNTNFGMWNNNSNQNNNSYPNDNFNNNNGYNGGGYNNNGNYNNNNNNGYNGGSYNNNDGYNNNNNNGYNGGGYNNNGGNNNNNGYNGGGYNNNSGNNNNNNGYNGGGYNNGGYNNNNNGYNGGNNNNNGYNGGSYNNNNNNGRNLSGSRNKNNAKNQSKRQNKKQKNSNYRRPLTTKSDYYNSGYPQKRYGDRGKRSYKYPMRYYSNEDGNSDATSNNFVENRSKGFFRRYTVKKYRSARPIGMKKSNIMKDEVYNKGRYPSSSTSERYFNNKRCRCGCQSKI